MGAKLATLGSTDTSDLLSRDIQALKLDSNGVIVLSSNSKSTPTFWKKHKKAILIGIGILVVLTVVVAVVICSGPGAAAAATAASLAALNRDSINESSPEETAVAVTLKNDTEEPDYQTMVSQVQNNKPLANLLEQTSTKKTKSTLWKPNMFESVGHNIVESVNNSAPTLVTKNEKPQKPNYQIGWVNGMNTTKEESLQHAEYMKKIVPNIPIETHYNKTNGSVADICEIVTKNLQGDSSKIVPLLQTRWTEFHEEHKDNPDKKYLQICHSQGAIHVGNALERTPDEIRKRVIVVAIAPARTVLEKDCFRSFNYVSTDLIPHLELGMLALETHESNHSVDSPEFCGIDRSPILARVIEHHKELIYLDPAPGASRTLDHDFQSPTYKKTLEDHIRDYINSNGEVK